MAATLPAINLGSTQLTQTPPVAVQQRHVPTPPSKGSSARARLTRDVKKRSQSKKEREIADRRFMLRAQQPDLEKRDTAQYRNSYKHNLCLEMLREGFHKSFAELFALIQEQNEERKQAGPESLVWSQVQLENESEKLDTLKKYLTQAEAAQRKENFSTVYQCQFQLACYFQNTGDKWLADHFFSSCLATSAGVKGDGGKMAAEGHCNVGLALEQSGEIFEAAENFERFYQLCKDHTDWELDGGKPMHPEACNNLCRIYTGIADVYDKDEEADMDQQLAYLKKACDMAKEGGDRKLAGEASFSLGVAHEKNGTPATALHYLHNYLETCRTLDDDPGIGKACEAIAKAYKSEGKIEESIKYLEMFVEVSEKANDERAVSRASSCLGTMFNSLGRYDSAVEHFNKSYNIARSLNDKETISASRVLFGVASAHKMMMHFSSHIESAHKVCLERIVEWKDNRGDDFEQPLPTQEESRPASSKPISREKTTDTAQESRPETSEKTAPEEAAPSTETEPAPGEEQTAAPTTEQSATPTADTTVEPSGES